MNQELSKYEMKAMRQLENVSGIKGRIEKEELKFSPNQEKLKTWRKELSLTEKAFRRTQVMI